MFRSFLFFLLLNSFTCIFSSDRYWLFFKDKNGSVFNAKDYFFHAAYDEDLLLKEQADSTNYPLNPKYIDGVKMIAKDIIFTSRWLNAVLVDVPAHKVKSLSSLKYVRCVQKSGAYAVEYSVKSVKSYKPALAVEQTEVMQGSLFRKNGVTGKGIRIAIFDAGFPGVNTRKEFKHLRENKQIIATYDFVKNRENVYANNEHGTMVLSCIAGIIDSVPLGLATEATFLLARTEKWNEPFSEEENWLAAVEWAHKNGARIINSSLGYIWHRYFQEDMDGHTSLVSLAARIAARKGMLVVNAMGNDGGNYWKMLNTPADVDSVLSVGGIDPNSGLKIHFSSFGPNANYQLKPNLAAFGEAVVVNSDGPKGAFGTSFATPLVTGFAACAWQSRSGLNNMELFKELERSAHLYPYYDYVHGYGIPQASFFVADSFHLAKKSLFFEDTIDILTICVDTACFNQLQFSLKPFSSNYLYYHISDKNNVIRSFSVIDAYNRNVVYVNKSVLIDGDIVRAHFKGRTISYNYSINSDSVSNTINTVPYEE